LIKVKSNAINEKSNSNSQSKQSSTRIMAEVSFSNSIDLNEYAEDLIKNITINKLIFENDSKELSNILTKFNDSPILLEKLTNQEDHRGISPLILAIMLQNMNRGKADYSDIINLLLKNKSHIKKGKKKDWSPVDEAIFHKDLLSISFLIDAIYERKNKKLIESKEKIANYLRNTPDVYFEMKWEFDSFIPFITSFTPSDTFKIWKFGENLRMDYTFDDFRGLKVLRIPKSCIFRKLEENSYEMLVINWESKEIYDPFENLDDEEKHLIMTDIFDIQRVNTDFKIKSCTINETKSLFGNPVFEKVNDWKAKKYNIVVNSSLKIQNKERSEYYEFDKEFYFDSKRSIIKRKTASTQDKDIKNNIVKGFKVKKMKL